MKIEERIEIARPPEEVYALVSDLERGPEWQPSLVRVDVERGKEVRRVAGREREASFEATRNEAPRLVPGFRIPPAHVAVAFAFEGEPRFCLEQNGGRLPFGCHKWRAHDAEFWKPYLLADVPA